MMMEEREERKKEEEDDGEEDSHSLVAEMMACIQFPRGRPAAPQLHEHESFSHWVVKSSLVTESVHPAEIMQLL
jgi:hypothetical protein